MTTTHKVCARCVLDVPKFGAEAGRQAESVTVEPTIIGSRLVRNSHLEADELYLTLGWDLTGADPRTLKQGRVVYWIWDDSLEEYDVTKPRFVGIVDEVKRRQNDGVTEIEIKALDYTTLFIEQPMLAGGIPEWGHTLTEAWAHICDYTGFYDPDEGRVISSVSELRNRLVFKTSDPEAASRTLGEAVPARFHTISKPTPPRGSTPWAAWQYCVHAMGLISYIDGDRCVVADAAGHFGETSTPFFVHGENILSIEEKASSRYAFKGILLKGFNPLTGELLESFYPPPGDARLTVKTRRATAHVGQTSGDVNTIASQYTEQFCPWIATQHALDYYARQLYEQWSRQQLEGRLTTAETEIEIHRSQPNADPPPPASVFDLATGDPIEVRFSDLDRDTLLALPEDQQRDYLISFGYSPEMAAVMMLNMMGIAKLSPRFNIRGLTIELTPDKFEVEIRYWSKIRA